MDNIQEGTSDSTIVDGVKSELNEIDVMDVS